MSLGALDDLLRLAEGKNAVAIGPGLGTHPATQDLVRELVARLRLPIVLDADGINAMAGSAPGLRRADGRLVLTPHPGEYARLLGVPRDEILRDRIPLVRKTAMDYGLTLVLKMARTLVGEAGGGIAVVPTGNPGMATGGTGDVLAGMIASQMAQKGDLPGAVLSAVYAHGLAGDIAAHRLGERSLVAGDIIRFLPPALKALTGE